MDSKKPPAYVPTLTHVVDKSSATPLLGAVAGGALSPTAPLAAQQMDAFKATLQAQLLADVRQRVAVQLPQRVREAVAQQVLIHTQQALRDLQTDVDRALQQAIALAIEQAVKEAAAKLSK
jgi:hypothetical protein